MAHKMMFMRTPSTYVGLTLPLKLPPKMTPMSLDQLKRGGLHGVLAVAEQSLSVATQDALVHLGQHRLKFPSLGVSETASKLFGLYLKSNNPSSTTAVQDKYRRKMEEFVQVGGGGEDMLGWTLPGVDHFFEPRANLFLFLFGLCCCCCCFELFCFFVCMIGRSADWWSTCRSIDK
jgi:hypothetical protein